MSSFKIGDKFIVTSVRFPTQNGLECTIVDMADGNDDNDDEYMDIHVRYAENQESHPYLARRCLDTDEKSQDIGNVYGASDLQLISGGRMPEPMFDLDDMELAEILMEDMK